MLIFIIWLIGFFVSIYVSYRCADLKEVYSNMNNISSKIFISLIVLGYAVLSWLGAVATYLIFKDDFLE